MDYVIEGEQTDQIEAVIRQEFDGLGVDTICIIDMAGNVIADLSNGDQCQDLHSLAALAAGNYGAVCAMANLIGEAEFSLLFHKGERNSIHFTKISSDFLMITIFGRDVSLGFLRLKVAQAADRLADILSRLVPHMGSG